MGKFDGPTGVTEAPVVGVFDGAAVAITWVMGVAVAALPGIASGA